MTRATTRAIRFPMREMALVSFAVAFAALLSGCNTVDGMGEDIGAGGRAVERAVE